MLWIQDEWGEKKNRKQHWSESLCFSWVEGVTSVFREGYWRTFSPVVASSQPRLTEIWRLLNRFLKKKKYKAGFLLHVYVPCSDVVRSWKRGEKTMLQRVIQEKCGFTSMQSAEHVLTKREFKIVKEASFVTSVGPCTHNLYKLFSIPLSVYSLWKKKKKKSSRWRQQVNFFPVKDPENAGRISSFLQGGNTTSQRLFGEKKNRNERKSSGR